MNKNGHGKPHTKIKGTIGYIDICPLHSGARVHTLGGVLRQTAATCSRRERKIKAKSDKATRETHRRKHRIAIKGTC